MIVINASNIHAGGAFQVALSFLYEICSVKSDELCFLNVFVSKELADGLSRLGADTDVFGRYEIFDTYGLKAFFSTLNNEIKRSDLVFTILGPNYLRFKSRKEVVGFAQLWMLDFDNPISRNMPFVQRNILRAKFYIQWLFFKRADHYVVELEHVKRKLISCKGVSANKISVVYNTVSSLYLDKKKWRPFFFKKNSEDLSLGIVARDYPHKNIQIFPAVADVLSVKYGIKVHFYVTLNNVEWARKSDYFKKFVSTVGALEPDQCPSFYEKLDGVVFPSLLECFSATPLEAMVMSKPLFASNRDFVRDVCGDCAIYFDPLDANDIAFAVASYFSGRQDRFEYLKKARRHALEFSTAKGRAEHYLKIIKQHLNG